MMKSKLLHIPLLALLFAYLFTEKSIGINLFFFQLIAIGLIIYHKPEKHWSRYQKLMMVSSVLLLIFSVVHFSTWAIVWSWISLVTTAIVFQSNAIRQIALSSLSAIFSALIKPFVFVKKVAKKVFEGTPRRASTFLYGIPFLAILVFSLLYAQANPDVDKAFRFVTGHFFESLGRFLESFFSPFFWMTILGIILASVLLYGEFISAYNFTNRESNETLSRKKKAPSGSVEVLKTYYKAAMYTIGSLIVMLAIFLFFEIRDVWFQFEWNGGELKYFVHNGTYVLILSILISALVLLIIFNSRLNFYPDTKLRRMSYVWIMLNVVLAFSVIVRTWHYIDNFALAYLRIGVIFFIAACLAGLYSVYMKIKQKKSFIYLLRFNSISILIIVISIASVNWDYVITKYNFTQGQNAFVHLRYLSEMSDKTLPLLIREKEDLDEIKRTQQKLSHLDTRSTYYITREEYQQRISERVVDFKKRWEEKTFWEWNLPEYLAFQKLTSD